MGFVFGILILIVGLLVAIGLHEIGHLAPAKRFGVKVPQYFIGFGPTLWSTRRGETEYGLKAIPLGGFVRMAGMYPARRDPAPALDRKGRITLVEEARAESRADLLPGEEHRDFASLSVPKKLTVMFGGPLMNWLLALVLLFVVFVGLGTGAATSRINSVTECVPEVGMSECAPDAEESPALAAGLRPGDRITSWNGVPVRDWTGLTEAIRTGPAAPLPVEVVRDGVEETLTVTPVLTPRPQIGDDGEPVLENGEPVLVQMPFVGVQPTFELVRQGPGEAVSAWWNATGATFGAVASIPVQLWNTVEGLINPGAEIEGGRSVVSVVGVGALAGEIGGAASAEYTLAMRAVDMLSLLASLNLALFVFNLIPLPPLDGGHIAGALVEGARRGIARLSGKPDPGPVDTAKLLPVAYVVVGFLLLMTVVLVWADIATPIL
ncbi:MAG: site-2 protease family protein [bacterium]|nr:site-2 protease family protein [bacterium]